MTDMIVRPNELGLHEAAAAMHLDAYSVWEDLQDLCRGIAFHARHHPELAKALGILDGVSDRYANYLDELTRVMRASRHDAEHQCTPNMSGSCDLCGKVLL